MIQNIIVILILISAVLYGLYIFRKNAMVQKISKCDGCAGCDLKNIQTKHQGRHPEIRSVAISREKFSYQCNPRD
jgi:hypothetical protein